MKLLLLLLSAGKLGKVLVSGSTMLISVAVYAWFYGWPYGIGFIMLLLIHELGHFWAAKQRGLDVGLPTFIPFVGAWIQLKDLPHDAETEAWIGFAGPLLGSLAALACYFLAKNYGGNLLLALSYSGFFLNLFNLIPLSPFDGGRITSVLSPRVWLIGVPVLVVIFFFNPSPMLILIAVIAFPQVIKAWKYDPQLPENQAYYTTSIETKMTYGLYYLGLVAFLAIMAHDTHEMLASARHAM